MFGERVESNWKGRIVNPNETTHISPISRHTHTLSTSTRPNNTDGVETLEINKRHIQSRDRHLERLTNTYTTNTNCLSPIDSCQTKAVRLFVAMDRNKMLIQFKGKSLPTFLCCALCVQWMDVSMDVCMYVCRYVCMCVMVGWLDWGSLKMFS